MPEPTAPSTRRVASASGVPARSAADTIASAWSPADPSAATMSEPHSSASSGLSTSASTIRASVSTAARVSAGEARANTASSSESIEPDPRRLVRGLRGHAGILPARSGEPIRG